MKNKKTTLKKPLVMPDKEWENIMLVHQEIINVLDKYNVPDVIACKILIDIERNIDAGIMRTIMENKK